MVLTNTGLVSTFESHLESPQYGPPGHEPGQLVSLQDTDPVLDISDDFLPGLLQAKVEVSTPEAAVVTVKYLVTFLQGKSFGKIQHRRDFLEILDSVLDIVLVGREVRVHKEERGSEEDEADGHGALRLELSARPGAEAVVLRDAAVPDEVPPQEDGEMEGAQGCGVEEDV